MHPARTHAPRVDQEEDVERKLDGEVGDEGAVLPVAEGEGEGEQADQRGRGDRENGDRQQAVVVGPAEDAV